MAKTYLRILIITLTMLPFKTNLKPSKYIMLPAIFSDNMVLQQNVPIVIWGNADRESLIKVQMDESDVVTTVADNIGKWQVKLDPMKAGGPHTLKIIGVDTTTFSDVMIGEVWICSGQSNMEFSVSSALNSQKEINSADYDNIRLFTITKKIAEKPLSDCDGTWEECSPETVFDFSAVGYFFGRELYKKLNVPIGLIHSSWGGTPIESWMNYKTLESDSDFIPILKRFSESTKNYPEKLEEYKRTIAKLKSEGKTLNQFQVDKGNKGFELGYAKSNFDDSKWKQMKLPGYWENLKGMDIDGAVWFRKKITIPKNWVSKKLNVELGSIDDFDITYVNGVQIGTTGEETPNYWTHYRKYNLRENINNSDTIVIAVRVFDHFGSGGFGGPRRKMRIYRENVPDDFISLSGAWKYKVETELSPTDITGPEGNGFPPEPMGSESSHRPAGLYNAMIYPLAPFAVRGAIWYQGETNAGRANQYRKLLPAMINDWRTLWKNNKMFFGIVSLANFMEIDEEPKESDWAELREAQYLTVKNDPNTSLAVTIDIGEGNNIHPKNKQDVGKRLALGALAKVYGFNIEYSGPEFLSVAKENNKIILKFNHVKGGLFVKGDSELKGFSIAGANRQFVWANAKIIVKNKIVVSSGKIKNPIAVRYNWANNPTGNLYNDVELPAIPFRTDSFDGITFNKK